MLRSAAVLLLAACSGAPRASEVREEVALEPVPATGLAVGRYRAQLPNFVDSMVDDRPLPGVVAERCAEVTDGGPVAGPDCVTATIGCDQTIVGHTRGGTQRFDTAWYEASTCWPATRTHDGGGERVYLFEFDQSAMAARDADYARVTFDTPCADLDVSVFEAPTAAECPVAPQLSCDTISPVGRGNARRRSMKIHMDRGDKWFFLVEGAAGAEGAFSLTLECSV